MDNTLNKALHRVKRLEEKRRINENDKSIDYQIIGRNGEVIFRVLIPPKRFWKYQD